MTQKKEPRKIFWLGVDTDQCPERTIPTCKTIQTAKDFMVSEEIMIIEPMNN